MRISLHPDAAAGQMVMTVADTGVGISPADLPHVFDRFYRGDKSRQRENLPHGSGLGLSICQSIVMAHGGTITAENSNSIGAKFTVRLPINPEAPRPLSDVARLGYAT